MTDLQPGLAGASPGVAILVVDDEPMVSRTVAMLLRREGFDVDTADNGLTALAKVQERSYDVILCDWVMPGLDGLGFYRELQRRHAHLAARLIVLTGFMEDPETGRLLRETGLPCLRKPVGRAEIVRVVRDALKAGGSSGGRNTSRSSL